MKTKFVRRCFLKTTVAALLAMNLAAAQAQSVEASMLSTLPAAVSVTAPVLLSAGSCRPPAPRSPSFRTRSAPHWSTTSG